MIQPLPLSFDANQTLEQLENKRYGEPPQNTHLVKTVYALRAKPLVEFTVEDLRLYIGQNFNLEYFLPLALNQLIVNPLAEGNYYPGDLLIAVVSTTLTIWQTQALYWSRLQFIVYQLLYETKPETLPELLLKDLTAKFTALQQAVGTIHPSITSMIALQTKGTATRDGGFIVLKAYDRWHLLTMNEPKIATVHFMAAAGVWRLWSRYRAAHTVETYTQINPDFPNEVSRKILPSADDYALLHAEGKVRIMIGNTSEDTIVTESKADMMAFAQAVQKTMDEEVLGLALSFTD